MLLSPYIVPQCGTAPADLMMLEITLPALYVICFKFMLVKYGNFFLWVHKYKIYNSLLFRNFSGRDNKFSERLLLEPNIEGPVL
jgi:hypothetical protein